MKYLHLYHTHTHTHTHIPQKLKDSYCVDDLALHANTPAQAESLLHNLDDPTGSINLSVKANKTDLMYVKLEGIIDHKGILSMW